MKPVALDPSETRTTPPGARASAGKWALALAALVVGCVAGFALALLFPRAEPRQPETITIGRASDWPEIKNGVPELVSAKVPAAAEVGAQERSPGGVVPPTSAVAAAANQPSLLAAPALTEAAGRPQESAQPSMPASSEPRRLPSAASSAAFDDSPTPLRFVKANAPQESVAAAAARPPSHAGEAPKAPDPASVPAATEARDPAALAAAGDTSVPSPGNEDQAVLPRASERLAAHSVVPNASAEATRRTDPSFGAGSVDAPAPALPAAVKAPADAKGGAKARPKNSGPRPAATATAAAAAAPNASPNPAHRPHAAKPERRKVAVAASAPKPGAAASQPQPPATEPAAEDKRLRVLGIALPSGQQIKECLLELRC